MARSPFGGTDDDIVYEPFQFAGKRLLALAGDTEVYFWTSRTGSQVTDLLNEDGVAVQTVVADRSGQIPLFFGPDGVTELWGSAGATGPRSRMVALGRTGPPGPPGEPGPPGTGGTDAETADRIQNGTATRAALAVGYLRRWRPSTPYVAGDPVLNPSGQVVTANADHTSGTTYSASNWTITSGGTGASDVLTVLYSSGAYPSQPATAPAGIKVRQFLGPVPYEGPTWTGVLDRYNYAALT